MVPMPRRRDATLLPWILCLIALASATGYVVWWAKTERARDTAAPALRGR